MSNKLFALFAFSALFLNVVGATFAQTKTTVQTNQLVALLPNSDGVMTLDVQKLLNEAAPQILSAKPEMLNGINTKIDELRDKTGLDARQFEQIAIGVTLKQISAREVDLEPVFLARGKYSAGALIAIAKVASKGKYREEKSGNRTIFIFDGKEIVQQNKPATVNNSWFDQALDRMINGLTKEIAVTALDENTLAFGSPARVRETSDAKSRVSAEALSLINRKPNAVLSFGAKLPNGLSDFVNLDNDELGKTLDSIRQMSGAVEVNDGATAISVTAKTLQAEQAQALKDTIAGAQMIFAPVLKSSKGEDKKVFARLLENAKVARSQTEVTLDLSIPQTDINILLAGVK